MVSEGYCSFENFDAQENSKYHMFPIFKEIITGILSFPRYYEEANFS